MSKMIRTLAEDANVPLTDPEMNLLVGEGYSRFELYHFALSLCSQKVRVCLCEKNAVFTAHDINLQMPQLGNYDPAYVRLRLAANSQVEFATGYTGRSSVSSEGFDPAVVPTLVDREENVVVVDSVDICLHIDRMTDPSNSLVPADLASDILRELSIVDATPHVAVLYGAHPDIDFRPARLRQNMPGIHDRKIEKIKAARDLVVDDETLKAAYDAKISKEEGAKRHVATANRMRSSVEEMLSIVSDLEQRLDGRNEWICGGQFTLADLFWAVSLFRMKWLGMSFAWEGYHVLNNNACPKVEKYGQLLFDRPSFRSAIIDWPRIPRSEFIQEYYSD